jgi:hypothetical protein
MAPSQDAPRVESGPSTLRRGEVAARLGVSPTTVRRLEERGELHPVVGDGGERLFDPAEVERLAATRAGEAGSGQVSPPAAPSRSPGNSGDLAARAFALFDSGKLPWEVVVETHEPPEVVAKLHGEYVRLGGGGLLIPAPVRSSLEKILGVKTDPEKLEVFVNVVGAFVRLGRAIVEKPCESCGSKQDASGMYPWQTQIEARWRHSACAPRAGAALAHDIEASRMPCCVCEEVLDLASEDAIYIEIPLRPDDPEAATEIEWWHVRRCNSDGNE